MPVFTRFLFYCVVEIDPQHNCSSVHGFYETVEDALALVAVVRQHLQHEDNAVEVREHVMNTPNVTGWMWRTEPDANGVDTAVVAAGN